MDGWVGSEKWMRGPSPPPPPFSLKTALVHIQHFINKQVQHQVLALWSVGAFHQMDLCDITPLPLTVMCPHPTQTQDSESDSHLGSNFDPNRNYNYNSSSNTEPTQGLASPHA